MEGYYTFHQSSRGYLHIIKKTVCQDHSLSYADDNCCIAIVADGHGSPACCRSDVGSRAVAEIALEKLKIFSEEMTEIWNSRIREAERLLEQAEEEIPQVAESTAPETPVEVEVPTESDVETVTEAPTEVKAEAEVETPTEVVAETEEETPTEGVAETEEETPTEVVAETEEETPTEVVAEAEEETSTEVVAETETAEPVEVAEKTDAQEMIYVAEESYAEEICRIEQVIPPEEPVVTEEADLEDPSTALRKAQLLDEQLDQFFLPKALKQRMRMLIDSIVASWHQRVEADLEARPLTEEEYVKAGSRGAVYRKGKMLPHVYGTTLIAALKFGSVLVMIQQGDGRCNVFYEDQTIDQPIPWDERCYENVTTSMCDEDAATSIRWTVLDLRKTPVIGCLLGSDGVEDSYRNMEGNYTFYKGILAEGVRNNFEHFEAYLANYFPSFSEQGSGDDISVAGILCKDAFTSLESCYRKDVEGYVIQDKLDAVNEKINSMERKYSILNQRKTRSEQDMEAFVAYAATYDRQVRKQAALVSAIEQLRKG